MSGAYSVTDALIMHFSGLTPSEQLTNKNKYAPGSGAYSQFNIIMNGATAVSPMPVAAWDYIIVEPLNIARAIGPNQIGTQQMTIEIGVRTNQKSDTSLRKLEAAINTILDDLQENDYLLQSTMGLVSLNATFEAGIDENTVPFARFGSVNLVYKVPK